MISNGNFYIPKLKNVVFFGSLIKEKEFIQINKKLSLSTEIITSPDQSTNIDKNIKFKVIKNIDKKIKNYLKKKYNFKETLFISMASRWIFSKETIKFFQNNLINSHPTRLPIDAGSGGFSWQIMRGDKINNQLFHLVDENLDTGPIIFNKKSLFPSNCNLPKDYYEYHLLKLLDFYNEFIKKLIKKENFKLKYQTDYLSSYNPRIVTDIHGWIDWDMNAVNLKRFIAAFDDPYNGASTYLDKKKVRIKKLRIHSGEIPSHPFMSGIVIRNDKNWIVVSTREEQHKVIIEEVLNEKGKNIVGKIKVGERFYTPIKNIEKAKSIRAKFNSEGLKK